MELVTIQLQSYMQRTEEYDVTLKDLNQLYDNMRLAHKEDFEYQKKIKEYQYMLTLAPGNETLNIWIDFYTQLTSMFNICKDQFLSFYKTGEEQSMTDFIKNWFLMAEYVNNTMSKYESIFNYEVPDLTEEEIKSQLDDIPEQ